MISIAISILIAVITAAVGVLIGYIIRKNVGEKAIGSAEQKAKNLVLDAQNRSETIRKEIELEAKEEAHKLRQEAEREIRERRSELSRTERKISQREESIEKLLASAEKKEERASARERELNEKRQELDHALDRQKEELEKISGLTQEEAKELLLEEIEKDCRKEASQLIKEIEQKAREEADRSAKEIITGAIQRCAADHVAETTLSVVNLPNDDMKGRIIGREGRNIRAIETATGVDLIIDDTPEAVIISGFDPVRREIARIALEKLIVDGRIHPAKIEEMVEKAKKEVNHTIKEE